MNSIHILAALRFRDLRRCAVAWSTVRFADRVFQGRSENGFVLPGAFDTISMMRHAAYGRVLDGVDLAAFEERILFIEPPVLEMSRDLGHESLIAELVRRGEVRVEVISQSRSDAFRRLSRRAVEMIAKF